MGRLVREGWVVWVVGGGVKGNKRKGRKRLLSVCPSLLPSLSLSPPSRQKRRPGPRCAPQAVMCIKIVYYCNKDPVALLIPSLLFLIHLACEEFFFFLSPSPCLSLSQSILSFGLVWFLHDSFRTLHCVVILSPHVSLVSLTSQAVQMNFRLSLLSNIFLNHVFFSLILMLYFLLLQVSLVARGGACRSGRGEVGHHPCNLQNIVSVMSILYSATPSPTFLCRYIFLSNSLHWWW